MSRPFSYHDENFTVINNILFVHINIGKREYSGDDVIVAIPPEIFDRMVTYNQYSYCSMKSFDNYGWDMYITATEDGFLRIRLNYL